MKAIEFLRVSTLEQSNDDHAGLPRQREANARTIQKHNLAIAKTIEIIDVSGTSVLHSPEVKELLLLIQSPDISGIVVADWDRLIRLDNFRDFALLQSLKETNTLIYLPDQVIDLNTQSGFLIGGFQSIISGNELTQIKKRMLDAKEVKRRNGEHPNNLLSLPFGVSYDYGEKRYFYTGDIHKVKKLFGAFVNDGIRNYRELERITGIHHRTIPNLLRNELYIGYRTYNEKRSPEKNIKANGRQGDKRKVRRPAGEIIRVKVIDEPAIDEAVFYKAQAITGNKTTEYRIKKGKPGERFQYSGFLKCGVCGERIYSTSGGKNHKKDYYYCRSKNYVHISKYGASECNSRYMQKEVVENTVTSFIAEKLTDTSYIRALIAAAFSDSSMREVLAETETLKQEIKSLDARRARFLDLYGKGLFSDDELDRKVLPLNNGISSMKSRLAELEKSILFRDKLLLEKNIGLIVETLTEFPYWESHLKRSFLRSQIPEITITDKGITEFTFNFCNLGNRMGRGSWRPRA